MKKQILTALATVMIVAGAARAFEFQPLSVPEAAWQGATHVAIIKYSDLTTSTTNTAQTLTNAILANTAVECMGLHLVKAFDTGNTNYTGSVLLTVGDGSDADLFLASTELASDGTEVFVKYGRRDDAITATATSGPVTNLRATASALVTNVKAVVTGTMTNVVCAAWTGNVSYVESVTLETNTVLISQTLQTNTVVSAVTAAGTSSSIGRKLYTAAGDLVFTFTPNTEEALSANTQGEVWVYFRVRK